MIARRRIAMSLGVNFFAEVINRFFPLLVLRHAQAQLGIETLGVVLFAIYLVDLLTPLIVFGYPTWAALRLSHEGQKKAPDDVSAVVSLVTCLKLIHAVTAYGLMLAICWIIPGYRVYLGLVAVLGLFSVTVALDMSYVLVATQRVAKIANISVLAKIVSLVAIFIWVRSPQDALLFGLLSAGSNGLICLGTGFVAGRSLKLRLPTLAALKTGFRSAAPLAVMALLMTALDRFDVVLVEHFFGSEGTGLYAAPQRLTASLLGLVAVVSAVFTSEMMAAKDSSHFTQLVNLSIWLTAALVVPIAVGSWLVGSDVLQLIFGPAYAEMAATLSVLLLSLIGQVLVFGFGYQVMVIKRMESQLNLFIALFTLVGVVLALGLESMWGIVGIATAVSISKLALGMVLASKARRELAYLPWVALSKVCLAAAVMVSVLLLVQNLVHWIGIVLGGGVIYIAVLIVLNQSEVRVLYERVRSKQTSKEM